MPLDDLVEILSPFLNGKYIFKSCGDFNDFVVVMKLPKKPETNETRSSVVNPKYAKYRAKTVKVIMIINKFTYDVVKRVQNSVFPIKIDYIEDAIITIPDWDTDLEKVCGKGVHYFRTLECAYYYGITKYHSEKNNTYTGYYIEWSDGGEKELEYYYVNGQLHGHYIRWHKNGAKKLECDYSNDELNGHYFSWHENGEKIVECDYLNGKLNGHFIEWHENGEKIVECDYLNGKKHDIFSDHVICNILKFEI